MTDTNLEKNANSLPQNLPISLIPFEVQLQNVVCIDIAAKRFPITVSPETSVNIQMNMEGVSVEPDSQQAQVIWEVQLTPAEPRSFLAKKSKEESYQAHVGIISLDPDKVVVRRLNRLDAQQCIQVYGIESIKELKYSPFD